MSIYPSGKPVKVEYLSPILSNQDRIETYSDGTTVTIKGAVGFPGISSGVDSLKIEYPDGTTYVSEEISNGSTGKPMEKRIMNRDGSQEITRYGYNSNSTTTTTDKFDANGKKTSTETITGDGWNMESKEVVTYDDAGNVVSTKKYGPENKLAGVNSKLLSNEVAKEMTFDGKVYTFNAGELRTIVSSLSNSKNTINSILNGISSKCGSISSTVSSNDSSLSSTMNNLSQLCETCGGVIDKLISSLETDIGTYISKTIANETKNVGELNAIDSSLNDISDIFGSIGS